MKEEEDLEDRLAALFADTEETTVKVQARYGSKNYTFSINPGWTVGYFKERFHNASMIPAATSLRVDMKCAGKKECYLNDCIVFETFSSLSAVSELTRPSMCSQIVRLNFGVSATSREWVNM